MIFEVLNYAARLSPGPGHVSLHGPHRAPRPPSIRLIEEAIRHLEFSFEVRNPVDSLQYWLATCRSMAEALITGATCREISERQAYLERAGEVLSDALAKIRKTDHPNQWKDLKDQEDRLLGEVERLQAANAMLTARPKISVRE